LSDAWANILVAVVTVGAMALTGLAIRSWRGHRSAKVLLLAAAFTVLAAKGLFLTYLLFAAPAWERPGLYASLAFDAVALALFCGAVLRP
jgi:hypothetical protein